VKQASDEEGGSGFSPRQEQSFAASRRETDLVAKAGNGADIVTLNQVADETRAGATRRG
jgi:hypothetical protein